MIAYTCTYTEINRKDSYKYNYGVPIQRVKKFDTFADAVRFSRMVSNTNINVLGKPVIEEISK